MFLAKKIEAGITEVEYFFDAHVVITNRSLLKGVAFAFFLGFVFSHSIFAVVWASDEMTMARSKMTERREKIFDDARKVTEQYELDRSNMADASRAFNPSKDLGNRPLYFSFERRADGQLRWTNLRTSGDDQRIARRRLGGSE